MRYAVNKAKRFAYDQIANCQLMHLQFDFPNSIHTAPDVRIIGIDSELLKSTKAVLKLFDINNRVCFQFDTTFGLTGYYVSTLNFVHPCLVNNNTTISPAIPLCYFFHEKKFEKTHNEFWSHIYDVLPELNDVAFFVKDCERGYRNAIKKFFLMIRY